MAVSQRNDDLADAKAAYENQKSVASTALAKYERPNAYEVYWADSTGRRITVWLVRG